MATRPINAWEVEPEPVDQGPDLDALVAALKREYDAANSEYERIRDQVDLAHRYYEARPFGNEVNGRSQIVLPDVQETIDYMVPSVLRTFVSGDKVVEFEATDEAEEQAADDATAAIGFNFMRQQDGYRVLHDWVASGLLEKIGVVKTTVTTEEKVSRETVRIDDPVQLEGIGGEIEDLTQDENGGLIASLKHERVEKRFIDVAIPLGEFRFSTRARHEDDADYLAHVAPKTRSDLVEMGFDRDQVYSLSVYSKVDDTRGTWERQDTLDADPEVRWHFSRCCCARNMPELTLTVMGLPSGLRCSASKTTSCFGRIDRLRSRR